jgi:hypothetical protein
MLAEWIHAVNTLGDIDGRQHIVDPTLSRGGTDFMTLRVVMRPIDPALPRDGTDFMTLRVVLRIIDPTLPRDGTDFMTLRVAMRIVDWLRES